MAKYLGATISSDLSWNPHVDYTVKKATNSLNFLRRNIQDCTPRVKEQCYKSLVRPVMEYASCVWDPNTTTNINKLEMVQRRAARFVKGDYDRTSSVTTMLNDLGWETLQERRRHPKASMFYSIVYGLVCIPLAPFLIPTSARATRGHNMKFLVPQSSVNAHMYSFFPCTTRIGTNFHSRLSQHPAQRPSSCCYRGPPCKHSKAVFNLYIDCFYCHISISGDTCTAQVRFFGYGPFRSRVISVPGSFGCGSFRPYHFDPAFFFGYGPFRSRVISVPGRFGCGSFSPGWFCTGWFWSRVIWARVVSVPLIQCRNDSSVLSVS